MLRTLAAITLALGCRDSKPAPSPTPATATTAAPTADAPATAPKQSLPGWEVPAGWRSEVIPFPLDFAPSLTHRGFEEIRFAPGMFDPADTLFLCSGKSAGLVTE